MAIYSKVNRYAAFYYKHLNSTKKKNYPFNSNSVKQQNCIYVLFLFFIYEI